VAGATISIANGIFPVRPNGLGRFAHRKPPSFAGSVHVARIRHSSVHDRFTFILLSLVMHFARNVLDQIRSPRVDKPSAPNRSRQQHGVGERRRAA
jgi:hypothetical protein